MVRGTHIRARRLGYWHHGIDCGDGSVIHYSGEVSEKKDASVRRTPLDDFAKGSRVREVKHRHGFDPDAVVARAESRLGEKTYDLLRDNCEHFAEWCATGRPKSHQIRRALSVAAGAAAAGALVLARLPRRRRA